MGKVLTNSFLIGATKSLAQIGYYLIGLEDHVYLVQVNPAVIF